jgi:hypothetical protein
MADFNALTSKGGTQNSKYDVEFTTYPADLFGNNAATYGKSWVLFNINVQQNSKAATTQPIVELDPFEREKANMVLTEQRAKNANLSAEKVASNQVVGGAVVGAVSKFSLSAFLGGKEAQGASNIAKGGIAGGAVAAATSIPYLVAGTATRETKRLKNAIQLPMPNTLVSRYSMEWDATSTMMYDLINRLGGAVSNPIDTLNNTSSRTASSIAAGAALGLSNAADSGAVSAATGLAANTKKEMIFSGVNFRSFDIDYTFYPKTAAEAATIKGIIKTFKYHMHPEFLAEDRFTFVYPSEFDITFYTDTGTENEYVFRVGTCVLKDMNVNYTPEGQWVTHSNGVPNYIRVSLTFQELGIHTKDSIDKGF